MWNFHFARAAMRSGRKPDTSAAATIAPPAACGVPDLAQPQDRQWLPMTQVLLKQGGGTQPTAPGVGPPQDRQPPGALMVTVCPALIVLALSCAISPSSAAIRRSRHTLLH